MEITLEQLQGRIKGFLAEHALDMLYKEYNWDSDTHYPVDFRLCLGCMEPLILA